MRTLKQLSKARPHLHAILVAVLFAGLILSALPASVGQASTTIIVNSFQDAVNNDGFCTLREAIISANKDMTSGRRKDECPAGSGADTIQLQAGTYTLTRTDNGQEDSSLTGDLDIATNLTIVGAGAGQTIIQAQAFTDRVFHVISGSVTLQGLTVTGGNTSSDGGGVLNLSTLTLMDAEIQGNSAAGSGGGLANAGSSLTVEKSTISGNSAGSGGGIHNGATSSLVATNSTISGNSAANGGGISNAANTGTTSQVSLLHTTVSVNTAGSAGGGIDNAGNFQYQNTIVAGNSAGTSNPDCRDSSAGTFTSIGHNLTGDATGCPAAATDIQVDPVAVFSSVLGNLQNNGGNTPTHALLAGSPALDAGDEVACPATDQRGVSRPQGLSCDIGAFELEQEDPDPAQLGPQFTVNAPGDEGEGICTLSNCTFREALLAAGARINDEEPDSIIFLEAANGVLQPLSPLPEITDPVTVTGDGVILDGSLAGMEASGLAISAGGSTVTGLSIQNFAGHGVLLSTDGGNTLQTLTITQNGGAGVFVESGSGNSILENSIFENGGLGIDLAPVGPTPNDSGDIDEGANDLQNAPVLFAAVPGNDSLSIKGRLNGAADSTFNVEFYASQACDSSTYGEGQAFLGETTVTTDSTGNVVDEFFQASPVWTVSDGEFITATATSTTGSTSEFSQCIRAAEDNVSWPKAMTLNNVGSGASANQYLDQFGQSRWYKFQVQPGSKLIVTLTDLPANFDLTVYKDIGAAFEALNSKQDLSKEDLEQLGAEFAPDAFAPDAFAPDAFAPDAFAPDAFAPDAFAPDAFAPDAFAPDAFAPDAFAPDAFAPDAFAPDAFAPDAFAPDAFAPDAFAPDAFAPDAFAPDAFASAQTSSLIAISAFDGNSGEGVILNTWDHDSFFYVRVRGRNGTFNLDTPFHLQVNLLAGACASVNPITTPSDYPVSGGGFKTVILTDSSRMALTGELNQKLAEFSARPEVQGVVVDVSQDARVQQANDQADQFPQCPYAKNQVAYAVKEIVDRFDESNPLEYVVIIGDDDVIPFFRHPDNALLANERNYVPPVKDNTASQASLKLGYVLSQDRYGARTEVSFKSTTLPLPGMAVGRLVETPEEILNMLDAYTNANGLLPVPSSVLVTGYDFLEDAALAVKSELEAGTGLSADTLITPNHISPADPSAWTADQLRTLLLGSRHDLIFLAGHFSAGSALAADYSTRLLASEVASSPVDLLNALVYSIGCHAGYNIVNGHAILSVSAEPDWAQAFARKGATLIAGTGYQYGDTDFIEYSERLYLEFTRQLRSDLYTTVPVGKALVAAKQDYLAGTPVMRGIHEKAYLEATLFGLPMMAADLPNRSSSSPGDPLVGTLNGYETDPGFTLDLKSADVSISPTNLHEEPVELEVIGGTGTEQAVYFSGTHGVVANPAEPVLPLNLYNATVSGLALRGIGFQGGTYLDLANVLPLLGSATTEVRGVHAPFYSNYFYPVKFWHANYYDALANTNGVTQLVLTPTQYMSNAPGEPRGTLREFTSLDFRLYYSNNTTTYENENFPDFSSTPALAAAPSIVKVTAIPEDGTVKFQMRVAGNPAAGIQEVWVTYTGLTAPFYGQWQSLYLTQNPGESTLWEGTLPLNGANATDLRYVVQAVNGVGLVSMVSNHGRYYIPGVDGEPANPSSLALSLSETSGPYGTETSLSAVLTSNGQPVAGEVIVFGLGPQNRQGITDSTGKASVTIGLLGLPGENEVRAAYAGSAEYAPSSDTATFNITKQNTQLTLDPVNSVGLVGSTFTTATLKEATGRLLGEKTLLFVFKQGSTVVGAVSTITDYAGRAKLQSLSLPPGSYDLAVYFSGTIPLPEETITLDDLRYNPSTASGTVQITLDCSTAIANPERIWPPQNQFVPVSVVGVADPNGGTITITITGIKQDEPVGKPPFSPDGKISGSIAEVRAERDQNGDGRVYIIDFTANSTSGASCSGSVTTGVPSDEGGMTTPIDSGPPYYDSTQK